MTGIASISVFLASAWHDWGRGGPGWWIVAALLFWVLLAGGILLVLRGLGRGYARTHASERESALEVLERRFAEGQLSVEDYQARRQILDPYGEDD